MAALAVAGLAAGQNSVKKQEEGRWVAPPEATAKHNPLAGNADALGGGRKLFLRSCAECHNEEGSGLGDAANLQLPDVQKQSDGALFWKVTNGNARKGMPSFSRLPELQRWQLVLFLRTLRPSPESSPAGANPPTSPKGQ